MMIQDEMNVLVPEKLREIENEYNITVLWAVESGSRAWGFASPDSDFDVRFIYKRKASDYLKLNRDRDVIELPIDDTWDLSGWDLDKTLKLLQKSNPTLYEWLQSPIVYISTGFENRIENLMKECFSEEKILYHYLNTAKNHVKNYLSGDLVRPKKYFYALRPILACIWVQTYHSAPPVLFDDLYHSVLPKELKKSVDYLLDLKRNGPEKMEIAPIQEIDAFLKQEISAISERLDSEQKIHESQWDSINRFFYEEIHFGG